VQDFDESDPKTWKDVDPHKTTMSEVYKKFGLDENTSDFVGHALVPILPNTIFPILHIFVKFCYKFVKNESYQFFEYL
jgi:RAB protein geranylgeranyltransferase component A